jgi:hypothetical protein
MPAAIEAEAVAGSENGKQVRVKIGRDLTAQAGANGCLSVLLAVPVRVIAGNEHLAEMVGKGLVTSRREAA